MYVHVHTKITLYMNLTIKYCLNQRIQVLSLFVSPELVMCILHSLENKLKINCTVSGSIDRHAWESLHYTCNYM